MQDVTAKGDHASDEDKGPDDAIDLATEHAEGNGQQVDGIAGIPPAGWMPTLSVESATGTRWMLWGGIAGCVSLLAVAGVLLATRLPAGTTLVGTPVAAVDEAPQVLTAAEAALAGLRLSFTTDVGGVVELTGRDLGLVVDRDASRAPVANGLPALTSWLTRLPRGPAANPVVVQPLTPDVLADVAQGVSTDPMDADVRVERAGVDVVPGEDGLTAGPQDVAAGLDEALATIATTAPSMWPERLDVRVGGTPEPPSVAQEDIDAVAAVVDRVQHAQVFLTAEVDVADGLDEAVLAEMDPDEDGRGDTTIELTGTELRTLVDVRPVPGAPAGQRLELVPNVEAPPSRLVALLASARVAPVMTASIEDASEPPSRGDDLTDVSTITGTVVPGETTSAGFEPDAEATMAAVIEAALAGGGAVEVLGGPNPTPAPVDMGIIEPVSTFTTFFPAGQSRVTNIQRMAEIVDGRVIPPGESFELNHAVGRRTRDNGFVTGGAIIDGELVSDVGGGVSQFATTFFNAAWFAGVDLVDWKPHSIYFDRYPAGREATVNYPNVNLEIRNDTPSAILIDTQTTDTSVTVTFWSTPYWQVQTISGPCACGGSFSITVDRIRTAPEGAPIEESWTTSYTVARPSSR